MEQGDPVHLYLLLDFLSLLFTTLLSDNPEVQLGQFVRHYERGRQREEQQEAAAGGPPTSGAEEVDRILTEARRRYGRVRASSFRQNIDAQNISVIHKPQELPAAVAAGGLSEVDKVGIKPTFLLPKLPARKRQGGKDKAKYGKPESSITTTTSQEESTTSSVSRDQATSSSSSTSTTVSSASAAGGGEEVNVRIPLEEASINLRIRSRDLDRPLSGRRIHVRVRWGGKGGGGKLCCIPAHSFPHLIITFL